MAGGPLPCPGCPGPLCSLAPQCLLHCSSLLSCSHLVSGQPGGIGMGGGVLSGRAGHLLEHNVWDLHVLHGDELL